MIVYKIVFVFLQNWKKKKTKKDINLRIFSLPVQATYCFSSIHSI